MVSNLMQFTCVVCLFSADDGMDKARMEKWLADGDDELIVQTFRRHPDDVLGFIDEYMEGGLKMIEEGKTEHEAMASFRIGVKFGKLADKAFGETIFTEYTASFASWSPAERKRFREGQKEYRAGKAAMTEPAKALEHFEKSLKLAEPLGDHWGTAMALAGVADAKLQLKKAAEVENSDSFSDALWAADRAIKLNEQLRLRQAQIEAALIEGELHLKFGHGVGGDKLDVLQRKLLRASDTPEYRRRILERCAQIFENARMTKYAEEVREKIKRIQPATTQPAKS